MKYEFKHTGKFEGYVSDIEGGFVWQREKYVCRCCEEDACDKPLNEWGLCKDCFESNYNHLIAGIKDSLSMFFCETNMDGEHYRELVEYAMNHFL